MRRIAPGMRGVTLLVCALPWLGATPSAEEPITKKAVSAIVSPLIDRPVHTDIVWETGSPTQLPTAAPNEVPMETIVFDPPSVDDGSKSISARGGNEGVALANSSLQKPNPFSRQWPIIALATLVMSALVLCVTMRKSQLWAAICCGPCAVSEPEPVHQQAIVLVPDSAVTGL